MNIQAERVFEARPPRDAVARAMRLALAGAGAFIAVLGVLIAPLPGPLGVPVTVLGLMILLRNSYGARRRFVRLQRRHPKWVYPLRRLLRREPEVAPVFWQQTLRMERLLVPRRARFLTRMRRRWAARRADPAAR